MNENKNFICINYNETEISTIINNFIKSHQTEEILQLITECELTLNENEVTIGSLNERGFKHLINIIIGRDYRNKIKYRINVQTIQKLQLGLHRAILKRLLIDEDLLQALIIREDKRDLRIFQEINIIKEQQREQRNQLNISEWIHTIANAKNNEGKLYSELPIEEQAFLILSDYCERCDNDSLESMERRIGQVLDNLSLKNKKVDLLSFLRVALNNSEKIYINKFYNYSNRIKNKHLSEIGDSLYDFPVFYNEAINYYNNNKTAIKDADIVNEYIKYLNKNLNKGLDIKELLCEYVIDDVLYAKSEIKRIEKEDALALEEKKRQQEAELQRKLEEERKLLEYRRNAYIIKINPEGVYKIGPSCNDTLFSIDLKNNKKHNYSKIMMDYIRNNISSWTSELIVFENNEHPQILKGVYYESIPELKKFPKVTMADYYMTLYTSFKEDIGLKYNNVLFAELYDNKIHFHGYLINKTKDNLRFNATFKNDTYGVGQLPVTIYNGLSKKTIIEGSIIYRTFTYPDKPINRLDNKKFNTQYIDQRLENKFTESPDTFWDVMEKLKMYVIHYD